MRSKPWDFSKEQRDIRDRRIVYLRDIEHIKNGTKQLTWKSIGGRFNLRVDAVRKGYVRSKGEI